jgi:rSAM/selenodomain-associated transferase 1
MKRRLVIFAKEPREGLVKTRLRGLLSAKECSDLYKVFLKDIVAVAKRVVCDERVIAYESFDSPPRFLRKMAPRFKFYEQRGADLGERMYNAFSNLQRRPGWKTIIIGSDVPSIQESLIDNAFVFLETYDAVFGPSGDGGYYLVGLNKPCRRLFTGIQWSSAVVMRQTLKKCAQLKLSFRLIERHDDVDSPEALAQLRNSLKKNPDKRIAKWTKNFLKIS